MHSSSNFRINMGVVRNVLSMVRVVPVQSQLEGLILRAYTDTDVLEDLKSVPEDLNFPCLSFITVIFLRARKTRPCLGTIITSV